MCFTISIAACLSLYISTSAGYNKWRRFVVKPLEKPIHKEDVKDDEEGDIDGNDSDVDDGRLWMRQVMDGASPSTTIDGSIGVNARV